MARPAYSAEKRVEIESKIKMTALALFSSKGYRSISLRAIAEAMQLSAPALYRYYSNKDALLEAIRADGFRYLQKVLATVRENADSPMDAVTNGMKSYLAFAMEEPELYGLMYELDQTAGVDEASIAFICRKRAFAEAEAMAKAVLQANGSVGDANQMAHIFWVSAHGLAALAVANQLDLGKSYEQLTEPVINTMLNGLL